MSAVQLWFHWSCYTLGMLFSAGENGGSLVCFSILHVVLVVMAITENVIDGESSQIACPLNDQFALRKLL